MIRVTVIVQENFKDDALLFAHTSEGTLFIITSKSFSLLFEYYLGLTDSKLLSIFK